MAGDWLKIEKATPTKPEVLRIAHKLGVSTGDAFTLCFQFWSWADSNSLDGTIHGITPSALASALRSTDGFIQALCEVGWLLQRDGALIIPNFGRHLGQSAKKRAEDAERQSRKRSRRKRDENGSYSTLLSSQEGGSEQEATGGRDPPRGFVPPTVEEVRAYCAERANNVDPEQFVDHYTANGWVQGRQGKPIKDWRAAVRTWERNDFRSNGNGKAKDGVYDGLKEFAARAAADGTLHKEHGT